MNLQIIGFCGLLAVSLVALEKDLVIVVCSYNNELWVERNLNSIFLQTYHKYRVIYIDDCSTDKTAEKVKNFINQHNLERNWILISNKTRSYKLANLYRTIHEECENHQIVVEIDGDDWLLTDSVLAFINQIYKDESIWLTYGGFRTWPQEYKHLQIQPLSNHADQQGIRQTCTETYRFMALRTFYAGLFKKIKKTDLVEDQNFFTIGSDIATMIPMLEMAGERSYYIDEPVYIYNTATEFNDFKRDRHGQRRLANIIKSKNCYQRLSHRDTWMLK